MRRLLHWYGGNALHLLAFLASFALAGYAATQFARSRPLGVAIWFLGAVIGHDLLLMPLYTLADRSMLAVVRHRAPGLPAVRWINYVRVPAALSGLLLLVWFPLILRLTASYHASTTLSPDPYLWHWLAVTGALFLLSAAAFAVRLRPGRPGKTPPGKTPPAADANGSEGPRDGDPVPSVRSPLMTLLHPGDTFPELTLTVPGGQTVSVPGTFGGQFGVLLFYRGSWCPYCNAQLRAFQRASATLTELGVRVAALSVDDAAATAGLIAKHGLTFPVGYGADARAVADLTGAFVNPDPVYLQSTGFVLDPQGQVVVSVYSSGAIGRLVPEDVAGLVRSLREHASAPAAEG